MSRSDHNRRRPLYVLKSYLKNNFECKISKGYMFQRQCYAITWSI